MSPSEHQVSVAKPARKLPPVRMIQNFTNNAASVQGEER